METYVVIVILFGVVILLLLGGLFFVNRLTLLKLDVETCFGTMKEFAIERANIFEEMSSFLEKNYDKEEVFIQKIKKNISSLNAIKMAGDGVSILKKTDEIYQQFLKLETIYSRLKKNEEYLGLIKKYEENRDRNQYAALAYDKGVEVYNHYRENTIIDKVSKLLHFPDYDYYDESL